jgi:predicted ferric reductase
MAINKNKRRLLIIVYLLFLITGASITYISSPATDTLYKIGQIAGVLGLSGVVIQLILSARIKFIEKGVGLDLLMRWHIINALLSVSFILIHPILLFLRPYLRGFSLADIVNTFVQGTWIGVVALFLIIGAVIGAFFSQKIGLKYEQWRTFHKLTFAAIGLAFVHSYINGTDIFTRGPLFFWWLILLLTSLTVLIYKLVFRKTVLVKNKFVVIENKPLSHNVNQLKIKPVGSDIINVHNPGQFAFLHFHSDKLPHEEHPFTISSSPTEEFLTFSIKESGDFTSQIKNIVNGDTILFEGPFGVFSNIGMKGPFIFIAGGIGITPIRSMIKYMHDKGIKDDTLLFYANQTYKDNSYRVELDEITGAEWLKVVYIFSQEEVGVQDDSMHELGTVDEKLINKYARGLTNNFSEGNYFVCGPTGMMKNVRKTLIKLGVRPRNIYLEKFSLK